MKYLVVVDMQNDFIEPGAELFSQMGGNPED